MLSCGAPTVTAVAGVVRCMHGAVTGISILMAPTVSQPRRVNVRTPEVMPLVQAEVESHYRSGIVERIRAAGGKLTVGNTTVLLARQFGFCYGVERAIDLAYAARKVFADRHIYLLGEI